MDDQQAGKLSRPLLGNGAVLAHRFERPLAADMDEDQASAGAQFRPHRVPGSVKDSGHAPASAFHCDWAPLTREHDLYAGMIEDISERKRAEAG